MSAPRHTFHLIANSHLDPVWLWDWREGLNEGIITVRTMLDLMDEIPELTYVRGESAVYEHIEREEPATFARILRQIRAGRWDPIGGAYLQPDTNLPATETFARIYLHGQRYFAEKFGRPATSAWAADSFGHSAGLPELLAGAGFRNFSFFRPFPEQHPLPGPAFWWEGSGGSRVLGYRPIHGWYGCERDEAARRLDGYRAAAEKQPYHHVAVYYGLGDHGGGPTRRLVREIGDWAAAHPDVAVVHSGLHRFFAALEEEIRTRPEAAPSVHRGELNFCQRGCYVSAARVKFAFRQAEAALTRAETAAAASRLLAPAPVPALGDTWRGLMFNSFHDILPGSSIERALDEQVDWTRGLLHTARTVEFSALNALARRADTSVPPAAGDRPTPVALLVWNPGAQPYDGPLELEASLDYRPVFPYENRPGAVPVEVRGPDGRPQPFQTIKTEATFLLQIPWRHRVLVHARLPALGWAVFTLGWVEGARKPKTGGGAAADRPGEIRNGRHRVSARVGAAGVALFEGRRRMLAPAGLGVVTVDDAFGSWGGCYDEPDSRHFTAVRQEWRVTAVETLERGPLRAALWVKLAGGKSELELTFRLAAGRDAIDVEARLFWVGKRARLKLVFPGAGDQAEFDVAGGVVRRGPSGEVPGGRWVRVRNGRHVLGFASDALYGFDASDGTFRASVVRSSRYAFDARDTAGTPEWLPVVDRGEYRFKFLLTADSAALPRLAAELEQPPLSLPVPAHGGPLGRSGSIVSLAPAGVRLLALKPAEDGNGLIVRLQETAGRGTTPRLIVAGRSYPLAPLAAHGLATYRLARNRAVPVRISELPL
jgi:alpha-mannosidase